MGTVVWAPAAEHAAARARVTNAVSKFARLMNGSRDNIRPDPIAPMPISPDLGA
jgi:hypothetical protein